MHDIAPGRRNLITDVPGLLVGNAEDREVLSGVTVILPEDEAIAGVCLRGGAPGTRETDALDPSCLVDSIHGLVLTGGSVFGLDAASGVTQWLAARGRGFTFGSQPQPCPVVPAANLFDLTNGGAKDWGDRPPYRDLGMAACGNAGEIFALGNAGAGLGALAGRYKGGLGSASAIWNGISVGAVVAVNAFGSPVMPGTRLFWASPLEIDAEFGGVGSVAYETGPGLRSLDAETKIEILREAASPGGNTTLAVVATDATLTPAQTRRLALMADDGLARSIRPVHTPFDGDIVFALATGRHAQGGDMPAPMLLTMLGAVAADVLARAVARAVYEAETVGPWRSYRDIHGR